jgi:ketosteroid isomerase-like protein
MTQPEQVPRDFAAAAYAAVNAGDLEGLLALVNEDVEFTSMIAEAEGTVYRGHDGVRAWWASVRDAIEDSQWELLDVQGDAERLVNRTRIHGVISGVPVEQVMWQAVRRRDGKVVWWGFYRSEDDAREAAGLAG